MSINLFQKHRNIEPILNNTWYNDEGITVYTCHTPFSMGPHRTTTISKSLRDATWSNSDPEAGPRGEDYEHQTVADASASITPHLQNSDIGNRANFIYLAQIDWKVFHSSKMRFGTGRFDGREIEAKEYIKKLGWTLYGRDCVFTGENGKEYRWRIVGSHPELILNDTSEKPIKVAVYHYETPFKKGSLEIFPLGQHMMDEIFVTFVYVEQLRKAQGQS